MLWRTLWEVAWEWNVTRKQRWDLSLQVRTNFHIIKYALIKVVISVKKLASITKTSKEKLITLINIQLVFIRNENATTVRTPPSRSDLHGRGLCVFSSPFNESELYEYVYLLVPTTLRCVLLVRYGIQIRSLLWPLHYVRVCTCGTSHRTAFRSQSGPLFFFFFFPSFLFEPRSINGTDRFVFFCSPV